MKKLITILLILAMFLPSATLADPDLSAMTDQELKDLITACSAELRIRATVEPEGILLFDDAGVRLYQIGDAYIERGRLKVPCVMYNDRKDFSASVSPVFVVCNGYAVYGGSGSELPVQSKRKCELDFGTADVDLSSVDDIYSLIFAWQVYSLGKPGIVFGPTEREEHRFW